MSETTVLMTFTPQQIHAVMNTLGGLHKALEGIRIALIEIEARLAAIEGFVGASRPNGVMQ